MSTWRMAGLNYVTYSNIAARVLRKSLKSEFKEEASKRDISLIKFFYWANGEMLHSINSNQYAIQRGNEASVLGTLPPSDELDQLPDKNRRAAIKMWPKPRYLTYFGVH